MIVVLLTAWWGYTELTTQTDDALRAQRPTWSPCPDKPALQCATLRVPLDHDKPEERTLDLGIAKIPAKDQAHRIGSLLVNFGGPGISGIATLGWSPGMFEALNARYDIVTFDPRGVGRSAKLVCRGEREFAAYEDADQTPETPEERAALVKALEADAAACGRRMGWLIPHLSTEETARDMDILRSVLGDERLTYLGYSYGGALGTAYSQLYPDRVGRMVLDSPGIAFPWTGEENDSDVAALNNAINAFAADCVKERDCPLGHKPDAAVDKIQHFVEGLDSQPLPVGGGRLTDGLAVAGISAYLYSPDDWGELRRALSAAFEGRGQQLFDAATSDSSGTDSPDARLAIDCADTSYRPTPDEAEHAAELKGVVSPIFGPWLGWGRLSCHGWPTGHGQYWLAGPSIRSAPFLVIGSKADPITPYADVKWLAGWLQGAKLVTVDGTQHTAYLRGNRCVHRTVEDYLLKGVVPDGDVDC
ncbi:alpha/beta hydrolase [Nonomuraea sp. NPDC050536]|uniref:alpha/beta hydrolase n=1 Tax=Nonomuraea sp. NPDC050536 TaxID=3364366 RepID=UPI0037C90683